jgi:acetyltransferase
MIQNISFGHYILKNLLKGGFKGKIFPVNPKHDELMGVPCFHSVSEIPGMVDMVVIVTPAATVPALAEECGKKKVKTLVVISAGFGETGTKEGHAAEDALKKTCEKYDMSMVGPNCLGVLRPKIGLNASFAATPEKAVIGSPTSRKESNCLVFIIRPSLRSSVGIILCFNIGYGFQLIKFFKIRNPHF